MPKDSYASGPSSNPSSKSYSGGGGGGVSSGKSTGKSNSSGANMGGLGVTTGKTIYGNTAFGPAGGMATGYATRTGNISGTGPSMTTFSNFRTPSGAAMFSGQAGNTPVTARNAQQAAGLLSAMQAAQGRRNGFGMLSGDPVTSGPLPPIAPTALPAPFQLTKAMLPALFRTAPQNLTVARSYPYTFGPRTFGNWPSYENGRIDFAPDATSVFSNPAFGYGNAGLGSYLPSNRSTQYKNNVGDLGGLGNMSTQYKNAPGSTMFKNNMGE